MIRRPLACLLAFLLFAPPSIFAYTPKDLSNDISYYQNTSRKNNLDANDRLYILYRLRNKYEGGNVDMSPLNRLIQREEARKRNPSAAEDSMDRKSGEKPSATKPSAPKGPPTLTAIRRIEKSDRLNISLDLTASVAPQATRIVDPQKPDAPLLRVELPDTQSGLDDPIVSWDDGPVSSAVVSDLPNGAGIQVQLEFRDDTPARVVRSNNRILIEMQKPTEPEQARPDPVESQTLPSSDSYAIQTGDALNIQVSPATELSQTVVVQPDGTIVFPLVGTVRVKDLTVNQMEKSLTQKLRPYVSKPKVTISISQFSNRNIYITGAIAAPGPLPYKSGMRLMTAISLLGGFKEEANRKAVKIYRGKGEDKKAYDFNAQEIMDTGNFANDFLLQPGDLVEVPRGSNDISVIGQVLRPLTIQYRQGMTLLDAMSDAGGPTFGAATKRATLFRRSGDKRKAMKVNIDRIMRGHLEADIPLEKGDIIMIPQKSVYSGTNVLNSIVLPWLSLGGLVLALIIANKN